LLQTKLISTYTDVWIAGDARIPRVLKSGSG